MKADEASVWHRVDAHEVWLWHGGDPLVLEQRGEDGVLTRVTLGPKIAAGQHPQWVIPAHHWQAARPAGGEAGYTLVSCVVAPGFEFEGFELEAPSAT